ncbi:MAG: GDSL-type esterase/lipase family protein [Brevundimonas sp.]|uniref:GDSL-type esterase/lipase family protein n=1 Tax=Brevundimonas sp. TaxID=1871086 RepID=UPI0027287F27|nr:GDSL-type esterase/lipase family protein [Brevundimonas sp.]MDO9607224.1 GDSL-type esterase/lipase family protein [Brevundimonas sp.]
MAVATKLAIAGALALCVVTFSVGCWVGSERWRIELQLFGYQPEKSQTFLGRETIIAAIGDGASVAFLGDSIVERGPWAELWPDVRVANRGVEGITVNLLPRELRSVPRSARTVIVMAGINDLRLEEDQPNDVAKDYLTLLAGLSAPGRQLLVVSTLPTSSETLNGQVAALNALLRAECAKGSCTYIDAWPGMTANGVIRDGLTLPDGVHLSGEGYRALAPLVRPFVG